LARCWSGWQEAPLIVFPAKVERWHRRGFRLYRRWKSRGRPSRPALAAEVRRLIQQMVRENATWCAPRIASKLRLLGHAVADSTVAKYLPRRRQPSSQSWYTILSNHAGCLAAIDFCEVPTAAFPLLYFVVVLLHERRLVVPFAVREHPNARWVSRQLREAFPFETVPRYLIRDRDSIYGREVRQTLEDMDVEEVLIAPRSPWQSPFVERFLGTLRQECLDHVIALHERHLHRILSEYLDYHHRPRAHLSLARNAAVPRVVETAPIGRVVSESMVGGLHHRYRRVA
jgi:transposase InsO family protein